MNKLRKFKANYNIVLIKVFTFMLYVRNLNKTQLEDNRDSTNMILTTYDSYHFIVLIQIYDQKKLKKERV